LADFWLPAVGSSRPASWVGSSFPVLDRCRQAGAQRGQRWPHAPGTPGEGAEDLTQGVQVQGGTQTQRCPLRCVVASRCGDLDFHGLTEHTARCGSELGAGSWGVCAAPSPWPPRTPLWTDPPPPPLPPSPQLSGLFQGPQGGRCSAPCPRRGPLRAQVTRALSLTVGLGFSPSVRGIRPAVPCFLNCHGGF
jgi:hypothetical protein